MAEPKREKMAWEDIERHVLSEISDAKDFIQNNVSDSRKANWDRYYGKPLGNEKPGRSKFISRDVLDTIEWMMPYFLQLFTAGEHKIKLKIKPKANAQQMQLDGDLIGEALRDKIDKDMDESERNRFRIFYEWFKDALVSGDSYIKPLWFTDAKTAKKTLDAINPFQMRQLVNDPAITITDYDAGPDGMFLNVHIEARQIIEDEFQAEGVPHWEMIVPEQKKDINDEYGIGQRTKVTVDYLKRVDRAHREENGKPYFKHLDELESGTEPEGTEGVDDDFSGQDSERTSYEDFASGNDTEDDHGPRRLVSFIEWYDRIDTNGDGYLEDVVCWVADNRLIRWEPNDEGFIQFSCIKPIIDCYKFHGIAWADLVKDIQNLKTMIIRRTLDNFDFANIGRWRVSPNAQVDLRSLMNNIPGETVRAEQGEIEDLSPRGADTQGPLALLGYTDQMKEERSGVSKIFQGQAAPGTGAATNGQMPDRGIARLMVASQQRMDLIARIFAETGLKDFYRKAAWLYQKHLKQPFTSKIRGQEITITPDMIQGTVITQTSMSIESAVGQQDAAKIQGMFMFLTQVAQSGYPALLAPDKVYRMAQQYVSGMGWSNPDEFLPAMEQFIQQNQQMQQQQAQQAQQQMQAQQQQQAQYFQLEQMDRKLKQMEMQQRALTDRAKLTQEERESSRDARQKQIDSLRDFQADILKLIKDGQSEKAKQMLEAAKLRQGAISNAKQQQFV